MTMIMVEDKIYRLISTLTEKTRQNKVVWERTASEDYYKAQFAGNQQVVIKRGTFNIERAGIFYALSIRNGNERLVEVIRQYPGDKDHHRLEQMFNVVEESAEHYIEQRLDNLLQELESR